jgi:hypothetical protein
MSLWCFFELVDSTVKIGIDAVVAAAVAGDGHARSPSGLLLTGMVSGKNHSIRPMHGAVASFGLVPVVTMHATRFF